MLTPEEQIELDGLLSKGNTSGPYLRDYSPTKEDRSIGEFAADAGIGLTKAATGFAGSLYGFGDLLTGGTLDEVVGLGDNFGEANRILTGMESGSLQASRDAFNKADGFFESAGELLTRPDLLLQMGLESSAYFLGASAGAKVGQKIATHFTKKPKDLSKSLSDRLKSEAGQKGATAGSVAAVTGMETGSAYQEIKQEVLNTDPNQLLKTSPAMQHLVNVEGITDLIKARKQVAESAGRTAAAIVAPIAMVGGAIGSKLNTALATGRGAPRTLKEGLKVGVLGEASEEGIQSFGGTLGYNVSKQEHIDPSVGVFDNMGKNLAAGIITGGFMGGTIGGTMGALNKNVDSADIINEQYLSNAQREQTELDNITGAFDRGQAEIQSQNNDTLLKERQAVSSEKLKATNQALIDQAVSDKETQRQMDAELANRISGKTDVANQLVKEANQLVEDTRREQDITLKDRISGKTDVANQLVKEDGLSIDDTQTANDLKLEERREVANKKLQEANAFYKENPVITKVAEISNIDTTGKTVANVVKEAVDIARNNTNESVEVRDGTTTVKKENGDSIKITKDKVTATQNNNESSEPVVYGQTVDEYNKQKEEEAFVEQVANLKDQLTSGQITRSLQLNEVDKRVSDALAKEWGVANGINPFKAKVKSIKKEEDTKRRADEYKAETKDDPMAILNRATIAAKEPTPSSPSPSVDTPTKILDTNTKVYYSEMVKTKIPLSKAVDLLIKRKEEAIDYKACLLGV